MGSRPQRARLASVRRGRIVSYVLLVIVGAMLLAALLEPPPAARRPAPVALPPAADEAVVRAELPVRVRSRRSSLVRVPEDRRLILTVRHDAIDAVELVGLDSVQPVQANTPAVFDLYTARPGSYPVRLRRADRVIGRLIVGDRKRR